MTLRGLLLEAYGFSQVGAVMLWGALALFVLAGILAVLGFWEARRTEPEAELLATKRVPVPAHEPFHSCAALDAHTVKRAVSTSECPDRVLE